MMSALIKRFNDKWVKNHDSECHEWKACLTSNGYGAIQANGKKIGAHRLSWIIHYGEIPNNLYVCHKCDNRKCVNPEHLFLGTPRENAYDMIAKGRKFIPSGDKNAMYKITPEIKASVIRDYMECKIKVREISKKYGISGASIQKICGTYRRGKAGHLNPNARVNKDIASKIRHLRNNGYLYKDICKEVGLSWPTVRSVINGESWT